VSVLSFVICRAPLPKRLLLGRLRYSLQVAPHANLQKTAVAQGLQHSASSRKKAMAMTEVPGICLRSFFPLAFQPYFRANNSDRHLRIPESTPITL